MHRAAEKEAVPGNSVAHNKGFSETSYLWEGWKN